MLGPSRDFLSRRFAQFFLSRKGLHSTFLHPPPTSFAILRFLSPFLFSIKRDELPRIYTFYLSSIGEGFLTGVKRGFPFRRSPTNSHLRSNFSRKSHSPFLPFSSEPLQWDNYPIPKSCFPRLPFCRTNKLLARANEKEAFSIQTSMSIRSPSSLSTPIPRSDQRSFFSPSQRNRPSKTTCREKGTSHPFTFFFRYTSER